MRTKAKDPLPIEADPLKQQVQEWRESRKGAEPTPHEPWAAAVPLAELIRWAAQGEVIHQDDTVMKILGRKDLIIPGKKDRKGIYTTGLISRIGEHRVALFLTGLQHAAENLSDLIKQRRSDLGLPIQMCDAIAADTSGDMLTILAHCLVHARRKFVEVLDDFPEECRFLLETLKEVYKHESATERGASP